jgi:putative spermidine/putrescine transport system permease protein
MEKLTEPAMREPAADRTEAAVVPTAEVAARRRGGRIGPTLVIIFCALFFLLPLLAMARFSLQNVPVIRLGWSTLFKKWSFSAITKAFHEPGFTSSFKLSLQLAIGTVVLTLALLLPTTLWVHLRVPKARVLIEFVTILPYMIPPVALVAGIRVIKPHARWFLNSDLSLIPFYVVLALPFTFRALDAGIRAIDVKTLVDASRSLGASWMTTVRRVLVPNLEAALISSAFLTTTVVLGEYTIANVLLKNTFPKFLADYQKHEGRAGIGIALFVLVATTLLFGLLTLVSRRRGQQRPASVF